MRQALRSLLLTASLAGCVMVATPLLALQETANSEVDVQAEKDPEFEAWLIALRTEARERGISDATIEKALTDVTPIVRVIRRDRNQPEVKQTYARYLKARVSDWRKSKGAQALLDNEQSLDAAAEKYGVQPRFITAIWGVETNYGTVPLTYSVFDATATLAYDKRRGPRFRRELFAALEILDRGMTTFDKLKGSWAGAMGQSQFMPESYLKYSVDMDGDGEHDIWDNKADVQGSIANYLKSFGWRNDQTWGRKVRLPEGGVKSLIGKQEDGLTPDRQCRSFKSMGVWRDLQDWQAMGIRRLDGSDLPKVSIPAAFIEGDEGDGEGYLVYRNFCSIMRYNPSFKYALSVGLLSDAINAGAATLAGAR
ncbi:lytic murein transglycosylase [Kordiimonas aquimaris]|uniref:lytic murein transglycosylase n=1 Tax=Kordiimonas aquimaris TaxID=707591 RepID=UPI0021CF65B0|nr:lytic murein transglycosylase [Kordiimonas aquimaris]